MEKRTLRQRQPGNTTGVQLARELGIEEDILTNLCH